MALLERERDYVELLRMQMATDGVEGVEYTNEVYFAVLKAKEDICRAQDTERLFGPRRGKDGAPDGEL